MPRRDELTYDLGPSPSRRSIPWPSVLLLVTVLALTIVLAASLVTGSRPSPETAAPAATASADPASPSDGTSTTPLPTGSDAGDGLGVPEGSREATTRFVRAWLDPDPKTREAALQEVAVPALTEQLMLTDPARIPRATPKGAPVLDEASTYSAQFTQALSTGRSITVYLVADPQAKYRWLTTSVAQA
ncbi:MAG: hypothetical protein AVDCRST_MAG61-2039 [uncultured Friedmanniella sp.]|uniref:Uncharacterized protein n=1 Tax=uncultured Friedmanniella sp. TaxID=335381 RepID=A0A6J4KWM0_9ACTN|nr:MAG: hypothetical protein AVDCRST_MAG61-2039 [uncultured Friedmanniella sp.]